jgi:pre-rRNA-processing protein TSR4
MEASKNSDDCEEVHGLIPDSASSSSLSSLSSEEDDMDQFCSEIVLGFAEAPESRATFDPKGFPSKLGGLPVWLYGRHRIPQPLRCRCCNGVLAFLMQIYAPLSELDHSFHRTMYVFVCRVRGCPGGTGSVRVLCGQLPRENPFYPFDADQDNEEREGLAAESYEQRRFSCVVCGFAASSRCGQCNSASYCSRDCQKVDWRIGHKALCQASREAAGSQSVCNMKDMESKRDAWRFEEFEVDHGPCPSPQQLTDQDGTCGTDQSHSGTLQGVDAKELPESLFKNLHRRGRLRKEDDAFQRFSDAMRSAPDQILRYWRGGRPLWASVSGRVCHEDTETLSCDRCGGRRVFEFQIVSQALYYIGVDKRADLRSDEGGCHGLDWATIVVFSCENSCSKIGGREGDRLELHYVEELVVVQRHG